MHLCMLIGEPEVGRRRKPDVIAARLSVGGFLHRGMEDNLAAFSAFVSRSHCTIER